jgi:hypothetical protein
VNYKLAIQKGTVFLFSCLQVLFFGTLSGIILFAQAYPNYLVCLYSRVFGSKSSNSRLEKFWNWEFTLVNDQLQGKRNEEVGLFGQTLGL